MSINEFAIQFMNNGYFGAYPTVDHMKLLENDMFEYIVRLNLDNEKNIWGYDTTIPVIHFPIKDNNVPQEWDQFSGFICYVSQLVLQGKKIFIHCKGGHGRSCLVVACIIYHIIDNINSREAIEKTINIHNQRLDLSVRWKSIKSPFSKTQYIFLYKYLNPVCILKAYNTGYQAGFSASSLFEIETETGIYSNIDAAFQAYRNARLLLNTETLDEDCGQGEYEFILSMTSIKFEKYTELQENLLLTGIRKIYDFSRYAFGNNMVGKALMAIRSQYLIRKYLK